MYTSIYAVRSRGQRWPARPLLKAFSLVERRSDRSRSDVHNMRSNEQTLTLPLSSHNTFDFHLSPLLFSTVRLRWQRRPARPPRGPLPRPLLHHAQPGRLWAVRRCGRGPVRAAGEPPGRHIRGPARQPHRGPRRLRPACPAGGEPADPGVAAGRLTHAEVCMGLRNCSQCLIEIP